jgi:hypothetical protein
MAIVGEDYPGIQIYRENFVDMQWAIGRLVDEHPEEGFAPRLVESYWVKGAAIMACQDEQTRDWLAAGVPTLVAWEGSRLKKVVAWFPGPAEDTERYFLRFRRLNRGLDTRHWRVYESEEEPNGARLVLSTDTTSIVVLEGMGWRPFSGVGQAIFSL